VVPQLPVQTQRPSPIKSCLLMMQLHILNTAHVTSQKMVYTPMGGRTLSRGWLIIVSSSKQSFIAGTKNNWRYPAKQRPNVNATDVWALPFLTQLEGTYTYNEYTASSWSSSVGIGTGYRLHDRGIGIRFPAGAGNFTILHSSQTGSGAQQARSTLGTGDLYPGVKRPRREADHSASVSSLVAV
jgi:hypothetical protein